MDRNNVENPIIPYKVLGHGNNMSFKKNVFRKTGLYIESLGAGTWMRAGEDTDLIYRALRKRMKILYSPEPLVYHNNWVSKEKGAELELGYILAAVAVFTKFALKMDKIAFYHILEKLRDILRRIGSNLKNFNKDGELIFSVKRLFWFAIGLIMGFRYLFIMPTEFEN